MSRSLAALPASRRAARPAPAAPARAAALALAATLAGTAAVPARADEMPTGVSQAYGDAAGDAAGASPRGWQPPAAVRRLFGPSLPQPAPNPLGVPSLARPARVFPEDSKLGAMAPGAFPLVSVDGSAMRFTPGVLIRDQSNLLVSTGTLVGSTWPVRYVLDPAGEIARAWILTDAELAAERNRASP